GAGIESDEANLAGEADVLQREEHPDRRGFVHREDALQTATEAIEEILRRPFGRLARGTGVLVRRHDANPGRLRLELLEKPALAQRSLPDDRDRLPLRRQLLRGLDGAGVDAFPELVRRALGDHRDRETVGAGAGLAAGGDA